MPGPSSVAYFFMSKTIPFVMVAPTETVAEFKSGMLIKTLCSDRHEM
jgi:hypothetical protein